LANSSLSHEVPLSRTDVKLQFNAPLQFGAAREPGLTDQANHEGFPFKSFPLDPGRIKGRDLIQIRGIRQLELFCGMLVFEFSFEQADLFGEFGVFGQVN